MRIVINMGAAASHPAQNPAYFTNALFLQLALRQPQHHFILLSTAPADPAIQWPANVMLMVQNPLVPNSVSAWWWFNKTLPALLSRHKADVFVSNELGCSLFGKRPQIMIVDSAQPLQAPVAPRLQRTWVKRLLQKYIGSARALVVFSQNTAEALTGITKVSTGSIVTIAPAAPEAYQPIEWEDRQAVKEQYTEGCEFFIADILPGQGTDVLSLLKAFSRFKKRQQSSMKLVITGLVPGEATSLSEKLKTYKYRQDVMLEGSLPLLQKCRLTAAAYAMVHLPRYDGNGATVLQAMQCQVPVIATATGALPQLLGQAALFADPGDEADIAGQMKFIYTNEPARTRLVEEGKAIAARYNMQSSAHQLWQAIQQAVAT